MIWGKDKIPEWAPKEKMMANQKKLEYSGKRNRKCWKLFKWQIKDKPLTEMLRKSQGNHYSGHSGWDGGKLSISHYVGHPGWDGGKLSITMWDIQDEMGTTQHHTTNAKKTTGSTVTHLNSQLLTRLNPEVWGQPRQHSKTHTPSHPERNKKNI